VLGSQKLQAASSSCRLFFANHLLCYILQIQIMHRSYCGWTDNPERRLCQRNDPDYHGSKTKNPFRTLENNFAMHL